MKTILTFLFGFACVMGLARSQTNEVGTVKTAPANLPPPAAINSDHRITYQTNVPYPRRLGELQVTYGGVGHDVKQGGVGRLLDPTPANGPAKPFHNVSVDPRTGKADGIILFSINF